MTITTQFRDGKFSLLKFEITWPTSPGVLGLTPYCSRADIYESILEPTAIAEFVITDKVGIFDHINFLEQNIKIEFNTYDDNDDAAIKYEFYPVIVDPAQALPDDKGIVYKITCVSKEALRSAQITNLSLVQQNIDCETVISSLLQSTEGLQSTKPLFLEKTQGLHGFNFVLINPFTAIDEVRLKAMSAEYMGHCFVFYENSKGYHFKSLEGLIKDGLTKIGDKYYTQSAAADISVGGARWRNILAFKAVQTGNQNVTRSLGAGNVIIRLLNVNTQTLEEPLQIDPRYLNFVQLNTNSVSASLTSQNELSDVGETIKIVQFNPDVETADLAIAAAIRRYYLSYLFNTIAHITVYGDTTVTIGDVITAEIPEFNALSLGEERPYVDASSTAAGNYLVTKCRHVLTFGEGAEYMQALEIIKEGYGGDAPTAI